MKAVRRHGLRRRSSTSGSPCRPDHLRITWTRAPAGTRPGQHLFQKRTRGVGLFIFFFFLFFSFPSCSGFGSGLRAGPHA